MDYVEEISKRDNVIESLAKELKDKTELIRSLKSENAELIIKLNSIIVDTGFIE